jgi:glycosyltransferase involved in cell wall biosynthesis
MSSSKPAKILGLFTELIDPARLGGMLVFNRFFIEALHAAGCDVTSFSEFDGPKFSDTGYGPLTPCGAGLPGRIRMAIRGLFKGLAIKPDIILCGHIEYSPMAVVMKWILRRPMVVICHGTEAWKLNHRRWFVAQADWIVAVSRFTADSLYRQLPKMPKDRIIVIPNTYDESRFKLTPPPPGKAGQFHCTPNTRILLTVCRLNASEGSKGYDLILSALPEIRRKFPDTLYVLVGTGPDEKRIRQRVKTEGLESCVRIAGFVPDEEIVRYYAWSDLFVMPSNQEGFGIVFLEAMATGRPALGGNSDGAAEPLLDGELGFLVNPSDPAAAAGAIIQFFDGKAPPGFYDPKHLSGRVSEVFGNEKFRSRVASLIDVVMRTAGNGILRNRSAAFAGGDSLAVPSPGTPGEG